MAPKHRIWQSWSCSRLGLPRNTDQKPKTTVNIHSSLKPRRLVLTMSGQVGDASYSVALYFNIGRQHLSDQRLQSSQPDDQKLVLGCLVHKPMSASRHSALFAPVRLTIHSQVAQRRTRCSLNLGIVTAQEEQDRVQRIPPDFSYFLFRDFRESQSGRSLEVNIVAE